MPIQQLQLKDETFAGSTMQALSRIVHKPLDGKAIGIIVAVFIGVSLIVTGIQLFALQNTPVELVSADVESQQIAQASESVVAIHTHIEDNTRSVIAQNTSQTANETRVVSTNPNTSPKPEKVSVVNTAAMLAPQEQVRLVHGAQDRDGDGLSDTAERAYGTDPINADSDFDGYTDYQEIVNGYDPSGLGRPYMDVYLPKIDKILPITYPASRAEADVQKAMAQGVAWYPGTATPGFTGNSYVTGHSSDYRWNPGSFKYAFRKLHNLEAGDTVTVRVTLNNGKVISHTYQVYDKQVTAVDDTRLWFPDRAGSILTLVTSWPIDSTRERLMVRAQLIN